MVGNRRALNNTIVLLYKDPGQNLTPVSPPTPVFISTTPATSTTVNIPSMGPSGGPPAVEPTLATAGPGSSTTLALPTGEGKTLIKCCYLVVMCHLLIDN